MNYEDVYVPSSAVSFPVLWWVWNIGISRHFQSTQANKKGAISQVFFLLVHRISSINSMFILVCFRPVFLLPSDHHDYYILRLGDFCKPSNMLPLLGRGKRKTGWWFQMFFFHPYLGKWSNFDEHIFPMRWFNHQLDMEMVVINSSSPISNQISTLLIYCVVSALHKGKIFSRSQVLKETN